MIEAMKQALEALEYQGPSWPESRSKAATALRQAIAEAEKQEPVAFKCGDSIVHIKPPIYGNTHPPKREAEQEPVAWISKESEYKLKQGGNIRGSVPVHAIKSSVSKIPLYTHPPKREPLTHDLNAAKAEIIQAERERLAMLCERLPFGDTGQSFAAWIRNGGKP